MSEWIAVDQKDLNPPQKQRVAGVEMTVFLSPHDVPTAIRGGFDKSIKRFVIEFRYLDDESTRVESVDNNVVVRVGKNSRRLYRIEIDVEKLGAGSVRLKLATSLAENAIDHLTASKMRGHEVYDAARRALSETKEQVLKELAPIES